MLIVRRHFASDLPCINGIPALARRRKDRLRHLGEVGHCNLFELVIGVFGSQRQVEGLAEHLLLAW